MVRIGFGYDAHRLQEGGPLTLGGIVVPWKKGLVSHSDGDVLLHAIMDSLLGAACLGDIGSHFPDTDQRYKGCSGLWLLSQVGEKINDAGYAVNNIDCTVVVQKPKIAAYTPGMRDAICQALGLSPGQVNVKATTTEGLGFTGREEGLASYAVCTLTSLTD